MIELTHGATPEQLATVYTDPYILRTGHDGRPAYPVFSPIASYLSAWVDGVFSGLFLAVRVCKCEIDVHALLLQSAIRESRELGKLFINWCFSDAEVLRITAYVIEGLETARNYTARLGFIQEGFRRDAYTINGQPRGVYVMGMTRKDWSAYQWAV